jgi:uncharacterized damage-inducible protein DinB
MRLVDPFIHELEMEARQTKRMLAQVPMDKLGWKPHPKSMSMGQLALHVASIPARISKLLSQSEIQAPKNFEHPSALPGDNLAAILDDSVAQAKTFLNSLDDETMKSMSRITKDGREIMSGARMGFIRAIMLNHWYHHRGQMVVYLRSLGLTVPAMYGSSADESM